MNSWDDDPDEQLRQRWQQTFANFKVQAHPSLGGRILNALPAGRRRRRAYRMVGLLLLVNAGFLYPFRLGEYPDSGSNLTVIRPATPNQPLPDGRIHPSEASSGQLVPPRLSVPDLRPGESIVHRPPVVNLPTRPGAAASGVDGPFGSNATRQPSSTDRVRLRSGAGLHLRPTAVSADPSRAASVRSGGTQLPVLLAGSGTTVGSTPELAPMGRSGRDNRRSLSTSQNPQSSVVQPQTNAVPVARLKPVGILPLSSQLSAHPVQLPIIEVVPWHPVEAIVARRRRQWFVEGIPLNSFQWMSVPPVATAYLSQVKAPAAFSPATLGYQVNGGIRWQHWQAHLSLGQVRRWAYYTVNENRYRVEPRPDNPNQLVRETDAVAENVSLPLIGAGLSQERLLSRGRYAVDLGGQATYLPTSQQALIGLRGGVGRRLAVSRTIELQVGLRVEYGLNRLLSERQQVVIHPLLIGIGFRIQPRIHP